MTTEEIAYSISSSQYSSFKSAEKHAKRWKNSNAIVHDYGTKLETIGNGDINYRAFVVVSY
jgi:hypothetical protein